jgi:HEAT repeat protein
VLDDIIELVENKAYGIARQMLAISLGNMKSPKAVSVLIELLNDPDVDGHAIMALGKLKSKEARSEIERFITHPNTWIRKEAKKALAKIDK